MARSAVNRPPRLFRLEDTMQTRPWRIGQIAAVLAAAIALCDSRLSGAAAEDNKLTPREKADGWVLLFDGRSPAGWMAGEKPLPAANVRDGSINPKNSGAYVSHYKDAFGDFLLACDFKMAPGCNSGIFIRTGDMKDPVQTGFEIQVYDSAGRANVTKNSGGALYDAQ